MLRPGIPLPSTEADAGTGQPRPVEESPRQPMAAERVRTLAESSLSATLAIPGIEVAEPGFAGPRARAVDIGGDVFLQVVVDSPVVRAATHARDADLAAVMEITDVAPVSVPHRIRGRARITGWLTPVRGEARVRAARLLAERNPEAPPAHSPGWAVLRLEVSGAEVDDLWGAAAVEPEELAEARPDPLAGHEAELLQHLAAAHAEQVHGLSTLLDLGENTSAAGRTAVPLALDRHGLRVRFCGPDDGFDVRFEFPDPVGDVSELRRAMHRLFQAAEG